MPDSIAVKSMRMLEKKVDDGCQGKLSDAEFGDAVFRQALIGAAFSQRTDMSMLRAALLLILDMRGVNGLASA